MAKASTTAAAAKKSGAKNGGNQPNSATKSPENENEKGDATAGELAALKRAEEAEGQLQQLVDFLAADPNGYRAIDGESPVQTIIRIVVNQAETIAKLLPDAEPAVPMVSPARAALIALESSELAIFSELPDGAAYALAFSDGDGVLDHLARKVDIAELSRTGGRATFERRLDFDPAEPAHALTTVWLVGDTGEETAAVRCEIPSRLPIGGGRPASIPAGHLIF